MAPQLQVIRFRDLLPVQGIPGFVEGLSPPTLIVKGEDLSTTEVVLINQVPSPEFMIVNKSTIWAQLPDGMRRISQIEVLSSKFTRNTTSSKVDFEIGNKTRTVEGVLKLVQLFTKWVLQSPGSDLLNPARGGGLQNIVGKLTTTRDMQPVSASITRAITTTVTQIRAAQINVPRLPLSERLLSASLVDLKVYEAQMQAMARVSIQSVAGSEAVSELVL